MIGGGSAGTAGGIKVTTFLVLGFVVWAEIRGEPASPPPGPSRDSGRAIPRHRAPGCPWR
jgi:Trk-type K+ transport system membrane component